MPLWRSESAKGRPARSERPRVIQNAVVCISFSGSSSLPSPTFSFVKNLIFLKPMTCERTRTSPWAREADGAEAAEGSEEARSRGPDGKGAFGREEGASRPRWDSHFEPERDSLSGATLARFGDECQDAENG